MFTKFISKVIKKHNVSDSHLESWNYGVIIYVPVCGGHQYQVWLVESAMWFARAGH
jgi:hypothetical protein